MPSIFDRLADLLIDKTASVDTVTGLQKVEVASGVSGLPTSATNPLPVTEATLIAGEPGSGTQLAVDTEGIKATYRLAGLVTPAATPTDVIQIQGSATKLLRILYVSISIASTATGIADVLLIRRSATDTGGTSTAPVIGRSATADAPATGVGLVWTVNPAGLGTLVSNVGAKKLTGLANSLADWSFTTRNDKGLVLNGVAEFLCVNRNGNALLTGEVWAYEIVWSEE